MIFIVETDEVNAALVAVLRHLAGHGVKPMRVASKALFGEARVLHRIETRADGGVDLNELAAAVDELEGVISAKLEQPENGS